MKINFEIPFPFSIFEGSAVVLCLVLWGPSACCIAFFRIPVLFLALPKIGQCLRYEVFPSRMPICTLCVQDIALEGPQVVQFLVGRIPACSSAPQAVKVPPVRRCLHDPRHNIILYFRVLSSRASTRVILVQGYHLCQSNRYQVEDINYGVPAVVTKKSQSVLKIDYLKIDFVLKIAFSPHFPLFTSERLLGFALRMSCH